MNDAISYLTQVIHSNPSTDTIIVSDFNLPDIQWDTLSSTSSSLSAFCDFVFNNSLIDQPTHVKGNILDLVLSDSNECATNLTVATNNNWLTTDHFAVTFQLIHQTPITTPRYEFDIPKANYDGIILSYLFDFDYFSSLQSQDVQLVWQTIKKIHLHCMNLFIPKVRLRHHQFPCWYTP